MLIANRYLFQRKLGEGGFCEVFKAKDLLHPRNVAVKCSLQQVPTYRRVSVVSMRQKMREFLLHEAGIMRQLDHPNVVRFIDFIDKDLSCYIVMEYADGGELFERIVAQKRFSESDAAYYVRQILLGVDYLHTKNFVHRDLKPENILLSNDRGRPRVIVTDFGLSRLSTGRDMYTVCGTLEYSAPEMLVAAERRTPYGREVDIWSVGVLTFILLSGRQPFGSENGNESEVRDKILAGRLDLRPLDETNIGREGREFICSILHVDPQRRHTISRLLVSEWLEKEEVSSTANIYRKIGKSLRLNLLRRKWECMNIATSIMEVIKRQRRADSSSQKTENDVSDLTSQSSTVSTDTTTDSYFSLAESL